MTNTGDTAMTTYETPKFVTRNDAAHYARERMPDASAELLDAVTDQLWADGQGLDDALVTLMEQGVDVEGYAP
jgi:hypothetical protein